MTTDAPPRRATWREWVGLALLTLPMLALATDISVLFLAMPSISADLQPTTSQMLWILHIYGFLIGGFLITMGRLGDRVGRRKLLLIGAGAFAVLAVVAASSNSPEMLIVVRALLGVAGATLMPSCYSLLRPMFEDEDQRRFAIAVMYGAFAVGGAIGPLLGGVLLANFAWGSVFLVNVPPLALLLVLGPVLPPEHRDESSQRLDLASVALSVVGMIAVIFALQEAAEQGAAPVHAGALVLGLVLLTVFVRRQRRLGDPLLDLALFGNRRFTVSLGMVMLTAIGGLAGFYLFTQYLQWVLGLSPFEAGIATLPFVVASGAGSLLGPVLARWFGQVPTIVGGLVAGAIGFVLAASVTGSGSVAAVVGMLTIMGLGMGVSMMLGSDLILSSAPPDRTGSAASMQEISGEVGTALGVAVGGAVGMIVYRGSLGASLPDGLPAAAANAADASVAGGLAAAAELAEPLGSELFASVRGAFSDAVQAGFTLGAGVLAVVAVTVLVMLRPARTPAPEVPNDEPLSGDGGPEPANA